MSEETIVALAAVGFIIFVLLLMFAGLFMQKRAMAVQTDGMRHISESLRMQQEGLELQIKANELSEQIRLGQEKLAKSVDELAMAIRASR